VASSLAIAAPPADAPPVPAEDEDGAADELPAPPALDAALELALPELEPAELEPAELEPAELAPAELALEVGLVAAGVLLPHAVMTSAIAPIPAMVAIALLADVRDTRPTSVS